MNTGCKREVTDLASKRKCLPGIAFQIILLLSVLLLITQSAAAADQQYAVFAAADGLTDLLEPVKYTSQNSSTPGVYIWESPIWLKLSVGVGGGLLLILIILSFVLRDRIEEKTRELNSKNRQLEVEIRDRKLAEDKLKNYSAKLKSSNELKDLFTDILRHDLINPATVIKGYVEYLIDCEKDAKKIDALKVIERNNLKLIQMIENAANLAKLESVEELEFEEMDLREVIEEVVQSLQPRADEKGIQIEFRPDGKYPAQVNRIVEEVFSNLISNSIKYSPPASRIEVKVHPLNDNYWKISVADNGIGISDDEKTYIFDRFRRAGKTNVKGTGLGLAIAKRIIQLHDGHIGVKDNPSGKGTLFWITLHK